jgi:hypothetical protein
MTGSASRVLLVSPRGELERRGEKLLDVDLPFDELHIVCAEAVELVDLYVEGALGGRGHSP